MVLIVGSASALGAAPASAAPVCGPRGGPAPTTEPWPLRRLNPAPVWPLTQGDGVTVAVIDSGVSDTHPALRSAVRRGRDFGLPQQSGQCDEVGHGTLVAGIIAGRSRDGSAFTGIAPEARILPVRVLRDSRRAFDQELPSRIAQAIRWAVREGADVVNLSLETVPTPELEDAVRYAVDRGVVLVAAAGNQESGQQRNQPAFPAGYPEVIAVAGVDEQGNHVGTSISGDYIDVAAPGLMIEGPAPGGGYRTEVEGGTSFAAAYVSGVAALVRSYYPDKDELPVAELARRITATADHPPEWRTAEVGFGVVNPYRAVTAVLGERANPPAGALPTPRPVEDPLASVRTAAVIAATAGGALAAIVLLGQPIVRRGRERRWRAG